MPPIKSLKPETDSYELLRYRLLIKDAHEWTNEIPSGAVKGEYRCSSNRMIGSILKTWKTATKKGDEYLKRDAMIKRSIIIEII